MKRVLLTAAAVLMTHAAALAQGFPGVIGAYDATGVTSWEYVAASDDGLVHIWFPTGEPAPDDSANCNVEVGRANVTASDFEAAVTSANAASYGAMLSAEGVPWDTIYSYEAMRLSGVPAMAGIFDTVDELSHSGVLLVHAVSGQSMITITCGSLAETFETRLPQFSRFLSEIRFVGAP